MTMEDLWEGSFETYDERTGETERVRGYEASMGAAQNNVFETECFVHLLEVADVDAETVHVHLRSWPRSAEEGPGWGMTYETLWDLIDLDDLITEFPLDDGTPFRWGGTWGVVVQGELVPIGIGGTGERLALAVASSYASNSGSWEWDDYDKFVPTNRAVGSAGVVVTEAVTEAPKQSAHQQGVREEDSPPIDQYGGSDEVGDANGFETYRDKSALARMGYTVRAGALTQKARRRILDRFLGSSLPPIDGDDMDEECGAPGSVDRLKHLAYHLGNQVRIHRKNPRKRAAVEKWRSDLEYLRREYHRGGQFTWPRP